LKKKLMSVSEQNSNRQGCPFGCCDGTSSTRRSFLKKTIGILSAPIVIFLAWPFIQFIIAAIFRLPKANFTKVGPMSSFLENEPVLPKYKSDVKQTYMQQNEIRDVWIIKHLDSKVTVFSPICPHLGCRYDWYPDAKQFICPCHGSVFSIDGKVLGGPSPRGLDLLPWKIENGDLYVQWERFRVGTSKKIRIG
jgi:menaquinol-cytochrome c reductase iron-sulfur subunit